MLGFVCASITAYPNLTKTSTGTISQLISNFWKYIFFNETQGQQLESEVSIDKILKPMIPIWTELENRDEYDTFSTLVEMISEISKMSQCRNGHKVLAKFIEIVLSDNIETNSMKSSTACKNLNVIWSYMLRIAQKHKPEVILKQVETDDLGNIEKMNKILLRSVAHVLATLQKGCSSQRENLFQVLTDVFCDFVQILESNAFEALRLDFFDFLKFYSKNISARRSISIYFQIHFRFL